MSRIFLAALPASLRPAEAQASSARLERSLQQAVSLCQRSWPTVELAPEIFVRHLARHMPPDAPLENAPATMRLEDLYLACACLQGDAVALSALEQRYIRPLRLHLFAMGEGRDFVEESRQLLRQRLLIAQEDGGGARLAQYSGRGSLARWLEVAAARVVLNLRRSLRPVLPINEALAEALLPEAESYYFRRHHGAALEEIFATALADLSPREKNLLHMRFVDGLTAATIGALHRVSRRTVHRRLEQVQGDIMEAIKRALRQRLSASSSDLASLLNVFRSEFLNQTAQFLEGAKRQGALSPAKPRC